MYVDDFIVLAEENKIKSHRNLLLECVEDLGFIVNDEKSVLEPSYIITYIGFVLDTVTSDNWPTLWVAPQRVHKLRDGIRRLLSKDVTSARQLARILGQCNSMALAVSYGKIMLRGAYRLLQKKIELGPETLDAGNGVPNERKPH